MGRFLELRFGQGSPNDESLVQREIVPVKAIQDAFIVLPDKRDIQITWKVGGRTFTRTEYYANEVDCLRRWAVIKHTCGISARVQSMNPVPLPMDIDEIKKGE